MVALLNRLGNPQRSFEAVHVVGTKGKSTAARRIAATIGGVAYTSPHVSGWHERLQTDPAGFERAVERVRAAAEELGATQFETLTAAAFADFAARGIKAAAIEAGLGGRLDATNVIDARVVLLTNVALEHTEVLG
jgi:dihydrofolate synthase/folylpolyglutamate synthase